MIEIKKIVLLAWLVAFNNLNVKSQVLDSVIVFNCLEYDVKFSIPKGEYVISEGKSGDGYYKYFNYKGGESIGYYCGVNYTHLPSFTPPMYFVSDSVHSKEKVIRIGLKKGTELYWREDFYKYIEVLYVNVPAHRKDIFDKSLDDLGYIQRKK